MTKNSCGRSRRNRPTSSVSVHPVYPEPPVRRWPHNITEPLPDRESDTAIHFLQCSLSYQNQTLAEIKALLERLTTEKENVNTDEKNSG